MAELNTKDVLILGLDARIPLNGESDGLWTTDRRARFLIRPEIRFPISVDQAVWPPAMIGRSDEPLGLWRSVRSILNSFPEALRTGSPVVIEISVICNPSSSSYWEGMFDGRFQSGEDETQFAVREFGYDIADRFLLSGLTNCMLFPEELDAIRGAWSSDINSFGLFTDIGRATAFKDICDRLVPEHAPFYVYRVRRIESAQATKREPESEGKPVSARASDTLAP